MKVLPMMQPWASLVVRRVKTTETRDRHTNHRGTTLVLATRTVALYEVAPDAWDALAESVGASDAQHIDPADVPRGKIIGGMQIVDSVRAMDLGWDSSPDVAENGWVRHDGLVRVHPGQRSFGDFSLSRRAWLLSAPVQFDQPIICRGMPGMFDAPPAVEAEAVVQWRGRSRG